MRCSTEIQKQGKYERVGLLEDRMKRSKIIQHAYNENSRRWKPDKFDT